MNKAFRGGFEKNAVIRIHLSPEAYKTHTEDLKKIQDSMKKQMAADTIKIKNLRAKYGKRITITPQMMQESD